MTTTARDLRLIAESAANSIGHLHLCGAGLGLFLYDQFTLGKRLNPSFDRTRFTTHLVRYLNEHGQLKAAKRVCNVLKSKEAEDG